jgi:type IV secretory pathway VirB2 component (pilin)
VTRAAAAILLVAAAATPALADHGSPIRIEGMSPLVSALLTGALAFLVALVVVVVIMVLTRKGPDPK